MSCELNTYPLNDKWTLYLHYKDLGTTYISNLEKLVDIIDVKTFWQTFNNVPKIYEIFSDGVNIKKMKRNNASPCAYSFFKNDISPRWEDKMNIDGFEFSVRNNFDFELLQKQWISSLVNIIGCNSKACQFINGIRIVDNSRDGSAMYRMEFWVDDTTNKKEIEDLLKSEEFGLGMYKFMYRIHKTMKE
jgi:hypothetical protein